jgi:hypothetical protein
VITLVKATGSGWTAAGRTLSSSLRKLTKDVRKHLQRVSMKASILTLALPSRVTPFDGLKYSLATGNCTRSGCLKCVSGAQSAYVCLRCRICAVILPWHERERERSSLVSCTIHTGNGVPCRNSRTSRRTCQEPGAHGAHYDWNGASARHGVLKSLVRRI